MVFVSGALMPKAREGYFWYLCLEHLCQKPRRDTFGICVWNTYANGQMVLTDGSKLRADIDDLMCRYHFGPPRGHPRLLNENVHVFDTLGYIST